MINLQSYVRLALAGTALALCVVVLGAYVRLSDAGLGCPDWPGCYGQLLVPGAEHEVKLANLAYPERPLESAKAWKEMLHRYLAGSLGLLILALAWQSWRRRNRPGQLVAIPVALVGVVMFQALLGMWTVTLLLKPAVVTAHLLGGMLTLALLWWITLRHGAFFTHPSGARDPQRGASLHRWAVGGVAVVGTQIALGGWTSANYAALACLDFPACFGSWWPPMDFAEAFRLWRGIGIDYEGGVLSHEARTAVHVAHRLGALLTLLYISALAIRAVASREYAGVGLVLLAVLAVQIALGIANVLLRLPLPVAAGHNAGAALLLLSVVTLVHQTRPPRLAL